MITFLFLSLFGFAQETQDTTLRDQAVVENVPTQNSDALETAGVIRIEESTLNPKQARNTIRAGLTVESYGPRGTGEIIGVSTYDLQKSGTTLMPSITLATMSPTFDLGGLNLSYGLEGSLGFASQSLNLITPNDVGLDANLQTLKVSLAPTLSYHWQSLEQLETRAQVGIGWMQLTQSSESSLARWTRNSQYWLYSVGLAWNWSKGFATSIQYGERKTLKEQTDWSLSAANLQVGAEVKW